MNIDLTELLIFFDEQSPLPQEIEGRD